MRNNFSSSKPFLYNFIKTDCGREKLSQLHQDRSFLSHLRLVYFILVASIRDFLFLNKVDNFA